MALPPNAIRSELMLDFAAYTIPQLIGIYDEKMSCLTPIKDSLREKNFSFDYRMVVLEIGSYLKQINSFQPPFDDLLSKLGVSHVGVEGMTSCSAYEYYKLTLENHERLSKAWVSQRIEDAFFVSLEGELPGLAASVDRKPCRAYQLARMLKVHHFMVQAFYRIVTAEAKFYAVPVPEKCHEASCLSVSLSIEQAVILDKLELLYQVEKPTSVDILKIRYLEREKRLLLGLVELMPQQGAQWHEEMNQALENYRTCAEEKKGHMCFEYVVLRHNAHQVKHYVTPRQHFCIYARDNGEPIAFSANLTDLHYKTYQGDKKTHHVLNQDAHLFQVFQGKSLLSTSIQLHSPFDSIEDESIYIAPHEQLGDLKLKVTLPEGGYVQLSRHCGRDYFVRLEVDEAGYQVARDHVSQFPYAVVMYSEHGVPDHVESAQRCEDAENQSRLSKGSWLDQSVNMKRSLYSEEVLSLNKMALEAGSAERSSVTLASTNEFVNSVENRVLLSRGAENRPS